MEYRIFSGDKIDPGMKMHSDLFAGKRANDPSAGSPTETLLRLLPPLSVKIHKTFHNNNHMFRSELFIGTLNR